MQRNKRKLTNQSQVQIIINLEPSTLDECKPLKLSNSWLQNFSALSLFLCLICLMLYNSKNKQ